MGKGKLGPDGWEVCTRAKTTRGTLQEVNAANNKLVKENNLLRESLAEQGDNASLQAEVDRLQEVNAALKIEAADIETALGILDAGDDTHWTQDGLPRVEVICELMGDDTVTREQIEAARPEFTRESANPANNE